MQTPMCPACGDIAGLDRFGFWCENCQAPVEVVTFGGVPLEITGGWPPPVGVHYFSPESQVILARAAARAAAIAARHLKRAS